MNQTINPIAQPKPGTVTDVKGHLCPAASPDSYPLYAVCSSCGKGVRCADGTADWCHPSTNRSQCST